MSNHKTICRAIAPEGWAYSGFDEGFYLFQSGNCRDGFREMKCLEEDLTKANLELMAQLNITRDTVASPKI